MDRFTKETGLQPIIGTMACESIRRQRAYLSTGCNAFTKKQPSSQPMSFWMEQDVLQYLKRTGIPYASGIYGDIVEETENSLPPEPNAPDVCSVCSAYTWKGGPTGLNRWH